MHFDKYVQSCCYHYTQNIDYFHHSKPFSYALFLSLAFGIHWYVSLLLYYCFSFPEGHVIGIIQQVCF